MRVGAGGNTWLKAAPMMKEVFWTKRRVWKIMLSEVQGVCDGYCN